jgi:hypothetical protein
MSSFSRASELSSAAVGAGAVDADDLAVVDVEAEVEAEAEAEAGRAGARVFGELAAVAGRARSRCFWSASSASINLMTCKRKLSAGECCRRVRATMLARPELRSATDILVLFNRSSLWCQNQDPTSEPISLNSIPKCRQEGPKKGRKKKKLWRREKEKKRTRGSIKPGVTAETINNDNQRARSLANANQKSLEEWLAIISQKDRLDAVTKYKTNR